MEGLEISVVKLSELKVENEKFRFDSEFFLKKYKQLEYNLTQIETKTFKDITHSIRKGIFDISPNKYKTEGVPFLRVQNITNSFVDLSDCVYISEQDSNTEAKTELNYGDLALSKVGSIGRFAFITRKSNSSQNVSSIKVNKEIINPHYLFIFLLSEYGQFQFEKIQSQQVQAKLELEDIRRVLIPLLPQSFQQEIEQLVKNAHALLEESKAAYKQAEDLLLAELGINETDLCPKQELNINIKTFAESFGTTDRLDAEYYQRKYDKLFKTFATLNTKLLGNIVTMKKSIEPGSEAYEQSGIPFIRVSNISKHGISDSEIFLDREKYYNENLTPKKDTILFSKDGSVGIAYKVEKDLDVITSGALLHLIVNDKDVLPDYLTLVLNSFIVKLQSERDANGAIIQHWKPSEIEKVIIPLLPLTTQEKIASLVQSSFALKAESKALLAKAKALVEAEIEK